MINHIWSVICENSSIDNESNKVSLFNVLESLTIFGIQDQVIGIPLRFEVLTLWERTEETPIEGVTRLIQIKPNGEPSKPLEIKIDLSKSHFHRTRISIQGFSLSGPGRYVFQIQYKEGEADWQQAAELPVLIEYEAPEEDQPDS
jgi:hypothetical protein